MLLFTRILVSTVALGASAVSLSGCGQQGGLYLPTEPAAAHRATLPQTLLPKRPDVATKPTIQAAPTSSSPPASAPQ